MITIRVGPTDLPVVGEFIAFRVTLPSGGFYYHTDGLVDSRGEPVRVQHTEFLPGGPTQPPLIIATRIRLLRLLNEVPAPAPQETLWQAAWRRLRTGDPEMYRGLALLCWLALALAFIAAVAYHGGAR